ncbi:hypothetical protein GCM10011607_12750 [Shewanella inventionis]|uniref:Polymer-forming cytoskeletal protein n=1 Tax=Shewanella inventionis TaxID=1738770 RepID=A0ABQ1IXN0_9GAMM|nr:hypothetical protein [Shewanella inventionis]GGB53627.1 hypothetical protein GCM10011607_12750 [Shewanella inventionis]
MTSRIYINGNNNIVAGRNIVINNGKVIVDGKDVTPEAKVITITVDGNIESLKADACYQINVSGNTGNIHTQSGDVKCGNVGGSISTMSGDVECGSINGSVSTMSGDVSHR